jgi:hypothetical protein
MIHHQNADAMGLVSALMKGITHPPDVCHFEYFQGVNASRLKAHWLGPCRQHFDDELCYAKIIGKL